MDAVLKLAGHEKQWIWKAAQHRTHPKLAKGVNDSVVKDDFVLLNAIGICGEVAWARWFGVPWFQNPGRGGDHHRPADLQLRHGVWCEVKTSRNFRHVSIPWTTTEAWDMIAFAHYHQEKSRLTLVGIADRAQFANHGELKVVEDVKERSVETIRMEAKWLWSSKDLVRSSLAAPRLTGGAGLRCPWCGGRWPCPQQSCTSCLARREATAGV